MILAANQFSLYNVSHKNGMYINLASCNFLLTIIFYFLPNLDTFRKYKCHITLGLTLQDIYETNIWNVTLTTRISRDMEHRIWKHLIETMLMMFSILSGELFCFLKFTHFLFLIINIFNQITSYFMYFIQKNKCCQFEESKSMQRKDPWRASSQRWYFLGCRCPVQKWSIDGNKISKLYICLPSSSWSKGSVSWNKSCG